MLAAAVRQLLLPSAQLGLSAAFQQQSLPCTLLLLPQAAAHSPLWPAQQQQQQTCALATSAPSPKKPAARPLPSRHERNTANHRFQQQRAEWRRQLKALRKQWWGEHRQRIDAHRASADVAQAQVAQLRQLRLASRQQDRAKHQLERDIRSAERAVEVAALRLSSAIRQDMRLQTIQQHKEARRQELLEKSRSWIPPEALEARIAAALDNPQSLGMAD